MKKINVRLISYESSLVDNACAKLIALLKKENAKFSGPIPLPTKYEEFTILRSVHINKKSREQFERRTHKRLIVLIDPSTQLLDKINRLEFAAGVLINLVVKDK